MCSRVKCRSCGKVTWAGCGAHIEQVMRGVPKQDRCTCDRSARKPSGTTGQGILGSLFGRRGGTP